MRAIFVPTLSTYLLFFMKLLTKNLINAKLKASLVHFFVSLGIFLLVASWVYFVAYPDFYFTMAGAVQGLTLVFLVDVVLGPLLSFMVYSPTKPKKEIVSDFAIIGMVQLGALFYGINTLYQEKPSAVILYPNSTASVIGYRELVDFPELGDLSHYGKLGKLPIALFNPNNKTQQAYKQLNPLSDTDIVASTDLITRNTLKNNTEDQKALQAIESKYGKVYVISLMAKYNGAYIAIDQNYEFIAKFGEKPIS